MTFASGLRSILRQDPDVIMVGEIRDSETAQIAVQAALTGHLVLSTLHTNDAPGAVSRLMEMHIEPYLVASVLLCSFAQRLVRKVCPHCAEPYDPPRALLGLFGIKDAEGATFRRGKGCYHCGNTGYLGRIGIFEVMPVTPEIQEAIVRRAHAQEISAIAQRQGVMNTLAQDAARKPSAPLWCRGNGKENRGRETFLKKGFPPPYPLLSQDFRLVGRPHGWSPCRANIEKGYSWRTKNIRMPTGRSMTKA